MHTGLHMHSQTDPNSRSCWQWQQVTWALQVPSQSIPIRSTLCSQGWVQQAPRQCLQCPASQYSFQPNNSKCDSPCPPNADCTGGVTLVPRQGHWVSAANSDSVVACPNPEACQGNRDELLQCLNQVTTSFFQMCITQAKGSVLDLVLTSWWWCLLSTMLRVSCASLMVPLPLVHIGATHWCHTHWCRTWVLYHTLLVLFPTVLSR